MHSNSINIILDRNIALWNLKFKSKDALDVFGIVKELYNSRTPNTMKRSSHAFSKKTASGNVTSAKQSDASTKFGAIIMANRNNMMA
jgi:hypothetical protein